MAAGGVEPRGMSARRVAGIVLAAGASQRMGAPKALVTLAGSSFVEHVVSALRGGGVDPVIVVTRVELADAVVERLREAAHVVVNNTPERGMQSSIQAGLNGLLARGGSKICGKAGCDGGGTPEAGGSDTAGGFDGGAFLGSADGDVLCGMALALVDQPSVRADTVRHLVNLFLQDPARIVVPRSPQGRRGHPVIFPVSLLPALRAEHAQGAREVLWQNADRVQPAEVDDPGAFHNVNTPVELEALRHAVGDLRRPEGG